MSDAAFANALSLEQLSVFIEVTQAGSFSAAARNLRRAQGSISYHISGLEQQLGVTLFDRGQRPPALTEHGHAMLRLARQVTDDIKQLRRLAWQLGEGFEPRVRLAVDVLFPPARLAEILCEFGRRFADVDLVVTTGIVDFAGAQVVA
ncbi:MAG: LysR family transcriptional regulator, partial [Myxococcota bacterium]